LKIKDAQIISLTQTKSKPKSSATVESDEEFNKLLSQGKLTSGVDDKKTYKLQEKYKYGVFFVSTYPKKAK